MPPLHTFLVLLDKTDFEWLDEAIFSNINDIDASETGGETLWQYSCEFISKNKIWIYIYEILDEKVINTGIKKKKKKN